jgi:superfamily II DNA or RNA helicase
MQGRRLRAWPRGHFDLIVIDEGHHAAAQTYRNVLDHLDPKWTLGFTGTADRGDGEAICGKNQVFEECTFEYFMHDAVRNGFLKRPVAKVLDTTIDLSALRVTGAKDLNEKEIESLLLPHVSEVCNELKDKLKGHRAVIFTPMIASADAIASALCSLGVSAVSVSGEDADRASLFAAFRAGRYQHIVNAMLCTEGWDEPFVDSAVILRPTKSRALYAQMAGRALRKYEGKPEGYLWGLNWKTHKHDLVHPVQIFDSPTLRINPELVNDAKALVDSGEEVDLAAALKRAQSERKERKRIALKVHSDRAKAVEYTYDPLGVSADSIREQAAAGPKLKLEPLASEGQVACLVKMGVDEASAVNWSKRRASGFIGDQIERRKAGKSSYRQQKFLRKLGHPRPQDMKFEEASAEINRLNRVIS